jgi:hypothetical protein
VVYSSLSISALYIILYIILNYGANLAVSNPQPEEIVNVKDE